MREQTQRFIADLWFVLALVMPLFGAMALALTAPLVATQHAGALALCVALTGQLSVIIPAQDSWPLFLALCALPSLWLALEALTLRLITDGCSLWWGSLLVWAPRHLILAVLAGGPLAYFGSLTGLLLTGVPALLYVASALLSRRVASRSLAFELVLGVLLFERFVLPWITRAAVA